MSRKKELLALAADAMDKGEDPFHISFLSEHEVTLDEVYDMSETIAQAMRIWLLLNEPQHIDKLAALTVEQTSGAEVAEYFESALRLNRVITDLENA